MQPHVQISFDCLPLRMVGRRDIPLDASPKFRAHCERVLKALDAHGAYNAYYLYDATCVFRLTNGEPGLIEFAWRGTVMTDDADQRTTQADLEVELTRETCDWLTEPVVAWFKETVSQAVVVEFDRYIKAGDLAQAVQRIERIQAQSDSQSGFVGMYL